MKRTILNIVLLLGLCCWAMPSHAVAADTATTVKTGKAKKKKSKKKNSESAKEKSKTEEAELSTIGQLLQGAEYLTDARPNLKAQYFIFLHSASWCGPCRMEMPKIAAEYPNIRKSGQVELILASADQDPAKALEFVNSNKGTFPVIAKGKLPQLPEQPSISGIPAAVFVDASGKILATQHGGEVMRWRDYTIKNAPDIPVEEDTTATDTAEPTRPTVAAALKKVDFVSGKPSSKARYYVFLHSASWCGPCRAVMPKIVAEYKKLKGKKVEIILVSGDKTEDAAKAYAKEYKVKFPVAMPASMLRVPGYKSAPSYPHATVVDRYGNELKDGHGSILLDLDDTIAEANRAEKEKKKAEKDEN